MNWQIPPFSYKVYGRNPLDTVVVQLKFQPILRVNKGGGVPEFQELVRRTFPAYREAKVQNVTLNLPDNVEVIEERVFEFSRPADKCKFTLAKDNITLEIKDHQHREVLVDAFASMAKALVEVYEPVALTRLGVRYINIIDRTQIAADLGRDVSWESLVDQEYLRMPGNIADFEGTRFVSEITSPMQHGEMTLRYGLMPGKEHRRLFRFDMDRYVNGELDPTSISDTVLRFTEDIFNLFHTFPGIDLLEWMSKAVPSPDISEAN